jgi:ribose transport system substrate-binding protein
LQRKACASAFSKARKGLDKRLRKRLPASTTNSLSGPKKRPRLADMNSSNLNPPSLAIPRRKFIRQTAILTAGAAAFGALPSRIYAAGTPLMVNSIRSLSNPYCVTWKEGGEAFARSIGADHVILVTEGDSVKGMADVHALIEKTGGNMVLNIDPNDGPDAHPIVEACVKAGVYVTTQWNKPADLHPWDFNPYYVCYISFDGVKHGEDTANTLIKAIGGSGGIVGLGGILANTPAIERRAGMEKAIAANPAVKLLDFQVANWKPTEAFTRSGRRESVLRRCASRPGVSAP